MQTITLNQAPKYQAPPSPNPEDTQLTQTETTPPAKEPTQPNQPNPNPETQPTPEPNPARSNRVSVDAFKEDTQKSAKIDAETIARRAAATPGSTANPVPPAPLPVTPEPAMSPEAAKAQTETFIRGRDIIQQRALSFIAKQPDDFKKFALDSWEFTWLVDVYSEYVGVLGKIPAWINILIAEICIMVPKVQTAWGMRKLVEENKRLTQELSREKAKSRPAKAPTKTTGKQRPDTKRAWEVDENGYFKYPPQGRYLKKGKRTVKPKLTQDNYKLLCKHNGKETIDKIFKINADAAI